MFSAQRRVARPQSLSGQQLSISHREGHGEGLSVPDLMFFGLRGASVENLPLISAQPCPTPFGVLGRLLLVQVLRLLQLVARLDQFQKRGSFAAVRRIKRGKSRLFIGDRCLCGMEAQVDRPCQVFVNHH